VTAVFTLCSNNYLGQARVLVESYAKHHPGERFIIGLIDRKDPAIDYGLFAPAEILPCEHLGVEAFPGMMQRYDIVEFNTAVKPFYFDFLFRRGFDKVIYLDPDIGVFHPFEDLFHLMDRYDVVMTPHTITPEHANADRWQRVSNMVGIYNLGFLAMRDTAATRTILSWWKKKLETECRMIPAEGLFVDQIWANYFPIYFQSQCHVLTDPGYNMAYWNFGERTLQQIDGGYLVNGVALKFFHFSNYKFLEPNVISGYSDYTLDQRRDLQPIYREYHEALVKAGYEKFSSITPQLKFRSNKPGAWKLTGMRIKVHGGRAINAVVKAIFGV
jgi:hypothetical protein